MYRKIGAVMVLVSALMLWCPINAYAQTGEEEMRTESAVDGSANTADSSGRNVAGDEGGEAAEDTATGEEEVSLPTSAFTEDGNGTLGDTATSADNKEFITVTTKNGNTFYIIIDRERNSDNVYFLNMVDESDLSAFIEETDGTDLDSILSLPTESETQENSVTVDETNEVDPVDSVFTEGEQKETKGENQKLYIIFIVCVAILGVAYFLKFKKKRSDFDEYESEEEYEGEYEQDDTEMYGGDDFEDREEEAEESDDVEDAVEEESENESTDETDDDEPVLQNTSLDDEEYDDYGDYEEEDEY